MQGLSLGGWSQGFSKEVGGFSKEVGGAKGCLGGN